jgi:hypothetical protein
MEVLVALRIVDRTSTAPQVGVARRSPKLFSTRGYMLTRAHTHHTRGTDSLSDVNRGTAVAVAPQVATGRTDSTSCSVQKTAGKAPCAIAGSTTNTVGCGILCLETSHGNSQP